MSYQDEGNPFMRNVSNGHVEVEQAPFVPAIARCYQAILSIEHAACIYDLSQRLDLEAV